MVTSGFVVIVVVVIVFFYFVLFFQVYCEALRLFYEQAWKA